MRGLSYFVLLVLAGRSMIWESDREFDFYEDIIKPFTIESCVFRLYEKLKSMNNPNSSKLTQLPKNKLCLKYQFKATYLANSFKLIETITLAIVSLCFFLLKYMVFSKEDDLNVKNDILFPSMALTLFLKNKSNEELQSCGVNVFLDAKQICETLSEHLLNMIFFIDLHKDEIHSVMKIENTELKSQALHKLNNDYYKRLDVVLETLVDYSIHTIDVAFRKRLVTSYKKELHYLKKYTVAQIKSGNSSNFKLMPDVQMYGQIIGILLNIESIDHMLNYEQKNELIQKYEKKIKDYVCSKKNTIYESYANAFPINIGLNMFFQKLRRNLKKN